ncbi:MAG: hypothetical protein ACFFCQ_01285 [Promethearchaeota archaeon]
MIRRPLERIKNDVTTQIARAEAQYRYAVFLLGISILNLILCLVLTFITEEDITRIIAGGILFLGLILTFSLYQELELKRQMLINTKKTFQPGVNVVGNVLNFMDKISRPPETSHKISIEDEDLEEI